MPYNGYSQILRISLKTEKSFIVHPWCLQSVVGLECIHWGWSAATARWGQGQLLGVSEACGSKHIFTTLSPYLCEVTASVQLALFWIVKRTTEKGLSKLHKRGRGCSATRTMQTDNDWARRKVEMDHLGGLYNHVISLVLKFRIPEIPYLNYYGLITAQENSCADLLQTLRFLAENISF